MGKIEGVKFKCFMADLMELIENTSDLELVGCVFDPLSKLSETKGHLEDLGTNRETIKNFV